MRVLAENMAIFATAFWFFFIFESRVLTFVFRLRKLSFSSDLLGKFFGGFIECQLQGTCFILLILWSAFVAVSFEGIRLIRRFGRK